MKFKVAASEVFSFAVATLRRGMNPLAPLREGGWEPRRQGGACVCQTRKERAEKVA